MVLGDKARWAERFRAWDELFLRCVVRVWSCIAPLPSGSHEDDITRALVDGLNREPAARRLFWCDYQFAPFSYTADGRVVETGRIDMAMIVDHDREHYLAYECKRLNVTRRDGTRRALAQEYVDKGVMRYVTEQYAEDLPTGCMMGYVMDGDLDFARARIRAAMTRSRAVLGLQGDLRAQASIGQLQRFATEHVSGDRSIEILHALLPFVNGRDGPDAEGGKGEECGAARHGAAAAGAAPAGAGAAALPCPMPGGADLRSFQAASGGGAPEAGRTAAADAGAPAVRTLPHGPGGRHER